MWAMGDYPTLASDLIAELGSALVAACGIAPGDRVLDVAAGSGNASIPAARLGARVVASDLTPELLESGRLTARGLGANIEWREADAEALPFETAEFDHVISCVGVMFAPHHQLSADELVRVCRPGGTIGLISWTPEGFIGQMFARSLFAEAVRKHCALPVPEKNDRRYPPGLPCPGRAIRCLMTPPPRSASTCPFSAALRPPTELRRRFFPFG